MEHTPATAEEFAGLTGVDDWRVLVGAIHAEFQADSFSAAAALVSSIARVADAADHHPDVDLRYPGRVQVTLITHDTGGLTTRDVELARTISALARDHGVRVVHTSLQRFEVAIDTLDADLIRPFWAAVLAYRDVDGQLVDPLRIGPTVWFQAMDQPRTERDRMHLDVHVPHDQALDRIEAAIAAGGRLVEDRFAPSWWVLGDVDGNEVCVCTWQRAAPR